MEATSINDLDGAAIYSAGCVVIPGCYQNIETGREIRLERVDSLPASLDGRVAHYRCISLALPQAQAEPSSSPDTRVPPQPAVNATLLQSQVDPGPYVTEWSLPPDGS